MINFSSMKAEETIDFHIRWAWYKINKWYNTAAAAFGGTMAMGYVLLSIDKVTGTPSTSLGPSMGMEATSLVRVLKNMEAEGLICRKSEQEDKRKVMICLTGLGKEKRLLAKEVVVKLNSELQQQISEKEMVQFIQTMDKINRHLNQLQP